MKRLPLLLLLTLAAACNKPTEGDCRKALANMQHLMGTENLRDPAAIEGEVRRCKGGSKKKAVECAIKAQTLDDLRHCDFYKIPANAPGVGGNTGSAGSATAAATGGGSMGDQGTIQPPPGAPGNIPAGAPGGTAAGAPQPPAGGTTGGPATTGGTAETGGSATGGGGPGSSTAAGANVGSAGANVGSAGANVGSAGANVGSAGANIH